MKLTRVIVRVQGRTRHVQGDFRSGAGSRVRLNLGALQPNEDVLTVLQQVESADRQFRLLREIGRV